MPSLPESPVAPVPPPSARVGAYVVFDVWEPAVLALQVVAANDDGGSLRATLDGVPIEIREVRGPAPATRQHLVAAGRGTLQINYAATVLPGSGAALRVDEAERLLMLRPSRYCPADRFTGFGASRFPGPDAPAIERLRAITRHVRDHLQYVVGSTGPQDDAVDVLLAGQGVCRDYAHLVVTLARAAGMAARLVAVYAPGLYPMDFHAVAEVDVDGVWHVVDATRLAPRTSLVRICSGRDAADTAWCTTLTGVADLRDLVVSAVAEPWLPADDGEQATTIS